MTVFIESPWLAVLPALLLLGLFRWRGRRPTLLAAVAWLAYACYEFAMRRRWLCTGECNIRVDLLLIYPILAVVSLAGVVAALRAARPRSPLPPD